MGPPGPIPPAPGPIIPPGPISPLCPIGPPVPIPPGAPVPIGPPGPIGPPCPIPPGPIPGPGNRNSSIVELKSLLILNYFEKRWSKERSSILS